MSFARCSQRLASILVMTVLTCLVATGARADEPAPAPDPPAASPSSSPSAAPPSSPSAAPSSAPSTDSKTSPLKPSAGGIVTENKAAPGPTGAGPRKPTDLFKPQLVEWKPRWAKFRTYEYVLTGLQVLAAIGATAIPGGPRWTKAAAFDKSVTKAIGAKTIDGERLARDVSDAGLVLMVNQRLIDDLVVAWWFHGKGSVGFQLGLMDAEALSFSLAIQGIVAGAVGRQRPYAPSECNRPLESQTANCNGGNRYRSFFSGHATAAFTMAGLTCMHHAYIPLYGNRFADASACIGTLAAASTVAMMRVVGNQHYFSDVLAGAGVGLLSGLGVPWVMHYRGGGTPDKADVPGKPPTVTATVMPGPNGISVLGSF